MTAGNQHEALGFSKAVGQVGKRAAMDLARTANAYVEERQPWAQAKQREAPDALDQTLATLARALVALCALFEPVTPEKMAELAAALGLERVPTLGELGGITLAERTVTKGAPLFPKVEPV